MSASESPRLSLPCRALRRFGDLGLGHSGQPEIMDSGDFTVAEMADNFRDIERINRYLGGCALTRRVLLELVGGEPHEAMTVLDVGSGSADIPWGLAQSGAFKVTATDVSPRILELATPRAQMLEALETADVMRLPYRDNEFDVVTCSLLIHHLDPRAAVVGLSEMRRVARRGVIVNDLVRNAAAWIGAWALGRLTKNRLSRADGPLSVRRAYTLEELLNLCRLSDLQPRIVRQFALYRVTVGALAA